jgi:hypothetical protein
MPEWLGGLKAAAQVGGRGSHRDCGTRAIAPPESTQSPQARCHAETGIEPTQKVRGIATRHAAIVTHSYHYFKFLRLHYNHR